MGKKGRIKERPVAINHLRLEFWQETPGTPESRRIREINRVLNGAELNGATPFTILKRRRSPIEYLVDKKYIGGDELRAAIEIEEACRAINSALALKQPNLLRVDNGGRVEFGSPEYVTRQWRSFANHWGNSDKKLLILLYAVIDVVPFYIIEQKFSLRHGMARQIVIAMLRNYCIHAGWVDSKLVQEWRREGNGILTVGRDKVVYQSGSEFPS